MKRLTKIKGKAIIEIDLGEFDLSSYLEDEEIKAYLEDYFKEGNSDKLLYTDYDVIKEYQIYEDGDSIFEDDEYERYKDLERNGEL